LRDSFENFSALENAFPQWEKIRLTSLRGLLIELRSTEQELESLDTEHKLGYIKDDAYLHRHMAQLAS
jgi:hypothetical protein